MSQKQIDLSIVIPCYNEQDNLERLYSTLTQTLDTMGITYEIILIDDGSRDATWAGLHALSKRDPRVVSLKLSRNFGHQLALSAGLSKVRGDKVAVLDADLQDPPELLPEMLALMEAENADVVYGQRLKREGETQFKKFSATMFYRIINRLSDIKMPKDTGDFRLMKRRVVDALNDMPEAHRYVRGMVAWLGFKQVAFRYHRPAREAGVTGYNLRRMVHLALDGIVGFSHRPLRITFYIGFALAGASAIYLFYTLALHLMGYTVPGWTSLMVVILILQSFQFIVLGIFGEYMGRLFMESKRRPLFIIAEVNGGEETHKP